jgi:hypothetical protein
VGNVRVLLSDPRPLAQPIVAPAAVLCGRRAPASFSATRIHETLDQAVNVGLGVA